MTLKLATLTWDASEPLRLARFWAAALDWEIFDETGGIVGLRPADGTGFTFDFAPAAGKKAGQDRIHLDLSSRSATRGPRSSGSCRSAPSGSTSGKARCRGS